MSDWSFASDAEEQSKEDSDWSFASSAGRVGKEALAGVAETVGMLADHIPLMITGNPAVDESLHRLFGNPGSEIAAQVIKGQNLSPKPRNKGEAYAQSIGRNLGRAAIPVVGAETTIPRIVLETLGVGVGAGVGGQGASDAAEAAGAGETGQEIARSVGELAGGGLGGVGAGAVVRAEERLPVLRGRAHPQYDNLVDTVLDLEGGGTLEVPKTSPKGALGPMQVMPETAKKPGYGIKPWDGKSQEDLARVGRDYLAAMTTKYNGDEAKILAAYNGGPGYVDKLVRLHGDEWWKFLNEETSKYVANGLNKLEGVQANNRTAAPMAPEEIANIMDDPEAAGLPQKPYRDIADNNRQALYDNIDAESAFWDSPKGRDIQANENRMLMEYANRANISFEEAARRYEEGWDIETNTPDEIAVIMDDPEAAGLPRLEDSIDYTADGEFIEPSGFEGLRPAIIDTDGNVHVGNKGDVHMNVVGKMMDEGIPEEKWGASGFVDEQGNFLTKGQAGEKYGVSDASVLSDLQKPDNVVDFASARRQKLGNEYDQAIAENLDFADRIHKGIDLGMITEAHAPNIESARDNLLQILDDGEGQLNKAQVVSINNNIAMLDEALQRLGKGSDTVHAIGDSTSDIIGKGEKKEPINDINQADAEDRIGVYGPVLERAQKALESDALPPEAKTRLQTIIDTFKNLIKDESGSYRDQPPRRFGEGRNNQEEFEHDPVDKLIRAIEKAEPLSKEQKKLYAQERAKRLEEVAKVQQFTKGEEGFHAELAQLKGAMDRVDYHPVRQFFSREEIDHLFDKIKFHNRLTPFEKINARKGLSKILGKEGMEVPTESELRLLQEIFPEGMATSFDKQGAFSQFVGNLVNLPRALMSTFDLSAPFRQGVFMVGRKEFWSNFFRMFKSFGSERAFQALQDEIISRPTYRLMKQSGLELTNAGRVLSKREEQFMSQWAERIPVAGHAVRASTRAYVGFLNRLRADVFDSIVKQYDNAGVDLKHDEDTLKGIARFVNVASGRGSLGQLNQAAPLLNGLLFSPRLIASRLQLMNPVFYVKLPPLVRKEAIKSLLMFSSIALTTLGLAKMGGADVEVDPRSSDFGKIKIGNTRYDVLGGFQQYLRTGAQLITGQTKNANTDEVKNLGEDYGSSTRLDVVQNFVYNKFAPVPSFVVDNLRGRNAVGQPLTYPDAVMSRFTPMIAQDYQDLLQEHDPAVAALLVAPGEFGVGVQTYQPRESKSPGRPSKSEWDFTSSGASDWDFAKTGGE